MEILEKLSQAVLNSDPPTAKSAAEEALANNIDPLEAIKAATDAIKIVGDKFEQMEIFLPHLIMAADAMTAAVDVLTPAIPKEKAIKRPKFVLGTVKGDLHNIGKNIVGLMLKAAGFEVFDLGVEVPVEAFIEKANEVQSDIIGTSALMTTTMPVQKELVDDLIRLGLRNKYKVMIGGGCTTKKWSEEIGADGWGEMAPESVRVAKRLTGLE
jgi:corrinoid protein of di/trimethylamine methyltransferase